MAQPELKEEKNKMQTHIVWRCGGGGNHVNLCRFFRLFLDVLFGKQWIGVMRTSKCVCLSLSTMNWRADFEVNENLSDSIEPIHPRNTEKKWRLTLRTVNLNLIVNSNIEFIFIFLLCTEWIRFNLFCPVFAYTAYVCTKCTWNTVPRRKRKNRSKHCGNGQKVERKQVTSKNDWIYVIVKRSDCNQLYTYAMAPEWNLFVQQSPSLLMRSLFLLSRTFLFCDRLRSFASLMQCFSFFN